MGNGLKELERAMDILVSMDPTIQISHIMCNNDSITALVHLIAYEISRLTKCQVITPVPQMITSIDDVDEDTDGESFATIIDLYAESIEKKIYDYLENYSADIERIKAANIPDSSIKDIMKDVNKLRDKAIHYIKFYSENKDIDPEPNLNGNLETDSRNFFRSIHNIKDDRLQSDMFNYLHHVMFDLVDHLVDWFEKIIDKSKRSESVITHIPPQSQSVQQTMSTMQQPQQQINLHPQPQPNISISAPTPRFEQVDFKDDELISKHIVANLWVMPEYVHQFKHMLHHMCETLDEVDAKAGRTEPSKFAFIIFHNTNYWMLQRIDKNGNSIPNTDKEYMAILMDPFYGITEPKMYFHNTQAEQTAS